MSTPFTVKESKNNLMELDQMGVYRLYSGEDGQSHIEELCEDSIKEIKLDGSSMNSVFHKENRDISLIIIRPRVEDGRLE